VNSARMCHRPNDPIATCTKPMDIMTKQQNILRVGTNEMHSAVVEPRTKQNLNNINFLNFQAIAHGVSVSVVRSDPIFGPIGCSIT
jgi:hypothetical protein